MTNEELGYKILKDIDFIKSNYELLLYKLNDYDFKDDALDEIKSVLNYIRAQDFSFIDNIDDTKLLFQFENLYSSLKTAVEAFINGSTEKRFNSLIKNNKKVFDYMGKMNNISKEQPAVIKNDNQKISIDEQIIARLEKLEKDPKKLLKEISDLSNRANVIIEKANNNVEQTEMLLNKSLENKEKILHFKELAEKQLQELTKIRDKQVSVELSEQFKRKTIILNIQRTVFVVFFLIGLGIFFKFNLEFHSLLVAMGISAVNFLETFGLRLVFGMPIIFGTLMLYNEYIKSNKLYEEYEFKRISAITLFNNHSRLKNELGVTSEELSESLKASMEKIFENPVHSIFGDKSADKNIGLEQLGKIISMIEKFKSLGK